MQEIKLKVYDILDGEEPPRSGNYFMVHDGLVGSFIDVWYWDAEEGGWRLNEAGEELYMPETYWGHRWAERIEI